ncbi:MAG TPA: rhamnogalacturonan lyase, partial [Sedimentisphaerales bacterium]|nr:rhamnogalacturonan lyase [Sedimentisphaerales bacterium]
MRATRVGIWVAAAVMFVSAGSAHAARWMEYLNRGVVAVHVPGSGVYVGWRMLGTDPQTIGFNVYRDGVRRNASPITTSTNFMDSGGTTASTYYIRPVIGGVEQEASEIVTVWSQTHSTQPLRFLDVPIQVPAGGTTPDGVAYTYSANDLSVGDLDGDGQYEIIVKWDPSNSKDNSQVGHTGNVFIDAYKLDGTKLWRIDLGVNIRAGAHYTQFLVWDLDGDGRAEVALKTAPGTIDGVGHFVIMGNDDPHIDYRDANGFIITGPEYFTVFNGLTGAEMATIAYPMPRGDISDWGDTWGNRGDRFLAAVAFLDGERPSIVKCRGYYGPQAGRRGKNQITALDFRNGQLTQRWQFTATINTGNDVNPEFIGQGHHSLSVIDVNGDGFDEIIYGAAVINHDGTGRFSTGLGHGDALHVSDINPLRPGYEVFGIHEGTGSPGAAMYAAESGVILWQTANADSGRGVAADIDPAHPGMECWHAASPNLFTAAGGSASNSKPGSCNFVIWWDADLSREISDADRIDKWVPVSSSTTRLLSLF